MTKKLDELKNHISLGKRNPLVKKILFIEGIARSGKFLLGNILNSFKDIEPFQCRASIENIPRLEKFGYIEKKAAQEILQSEIDQYCYEMMIGRNAFNYRESDKSCLFNNPKQKELMQRYLEKEGEYAVKKYYQKNIYSSYIVHEMMPNIKILLDTFSEAKVISIQRNPIDLVYSWHKRNLQKGLGVNPIRGTIILKYKNRIIPWYISRKASEYISLSKNIDKTILSIETLFELNKKTYEKLSDKNRNKIISIHYEDILLNPKSAIKKIVKFLNKKTLPSIGKVLKSENLPQKSISNNKKLEEIEKIASPKYIKKLIELEKKYKNKLAIYDKLIYNKN